MKRPTFLTVWLVLLSIGAAFGVLGSLSLLGLNFLTGLPGMSTALAALPPWYTIVALVLTTVQVIAVVFLWRWKMLGFHLTVGATVVSVVVSYIVSGASSLVGLLISIVAVAVLYFAMKPVWGNFK